MEWGVRVEGRRMPFNTYITRGSCHVCRKKGRCNVVGDDELKPPAAAPLTLFTALPTIGEGWKRGECGGAECERPQARLGLVLGWGGGGAEGLLACRVPLRHRVICLDLVQQFPAGGQIDPRALLQLGIELSFRDLARRYHGEAGLNYFFQTPTQCLLLVLLRHLIRPPHLPLILAHRDVLDVSESRRGAPDECAPTAAYALAYRLFLRRFAPPLQPLLGGAFCCGLVALLRLQPCIDVLHQKRPHLRRRRRAQA